MNWLLGYQASMPDHRPNIHPNYQADSNTPQIGDGPISDPQSVLVKYQCTGRNLIRISARARYESWLSAAYHHLRKPLRDLAF